MFELCDDSGSESGQFRWVSVDFDVYSCEALGSYQDKESSEKEESLKCRFSEHAASLQFVVVFALVTLVCPPKLSGLKKDVAGADVAFVFFYGINSQIILLDGQEFDLLL